MPLLPTRRHQHQREAAGEGAGGSSADAADSGVEVEDGPNADSDGGVDALGPAARAASTDCAEDSGAHGISAPHYLVAAASTASVRPCMPASACPELLKSIEYPRAATLPKMYLSCYRPVHHVLVGLRVLGMQVRNVYGERVCIWSGSEGEQCWTEAVAGAGKDAAPFNVLLTCYTLFERNSAEQKLDRNFLKKWRWSHMVLVRAACFTP